MFMTFKGRLVLVLALIWTDLNLKKSARAGVTTTATLFISGGTFIYLYILLLKTQLAFLSPANSC